MEMQNDDALNDIILINHHAIDRQKWDHCIDCSLSGTLCLYSWFLDILCPQWSALVMGDYAFVMPLPIRSRYGFYALLQPLFIQQLGVFGTLPSSPEIIQLFINNIPRNIRLVDYHFNHLNPLPSGSTIEQYPNLVLPLNTSYAELYAAYSTNLKRKLKQANESGLILDKEGDGRQVVHLFRKYNTKSSGIITDQWYRNLHRVIAACSSHEMVDVWIVKNGDDVLLAGIVILKSKKHQRVILNLIAQSHKGLDTHAGAWLINQYIQHHAGSGLLLDFEGSKHKGVAQFYSSFGTKPESYPRYHRVRFPLSFLKMIRLL